MFNFKYARSLIFEYVVTKIAERKKVINFGKEKLKVYFGALFKNINHEMYL